MHSVTLLRRAQERRGHLTRRVVLGASVGLLALAVAAPAQAAPAVRVKAQDGVLHVAGTPFSDSVVLRLAAGNSAVGEILVDNDTAADFTFNVADVQAVVVDGGRGADRLSVDTSNGAFPAGLQIILNGGAGDDELLGGLGHQVLIGGSGDDTIDGNQGADDQFGGFGNDVIRWDPGDGSDLVDGGPGFDSMQFFGSAGSETFRAVQNGTRVTFTRDLGNIVMDLNDTERIDLQPLAGNDDLTVENIAGTDLRSIDVDLATDGFLDSVTVNGSAAADAFHIVAGAGTVSVSRAGTPTVRVSGADVASDFGQSDSLTVAGLGGSDSFDVGQGVTNLIDLHTID
jgi:hemolysin type calcium-binding protein